MKPPHLIKHLIPLSWRPSTRPIVKAYREILLRDPSRKEIFAWERKEREITLLPDFLKETPEYIEITLLLKNELRSIYRMFLFREPTEDESACHIEEIHGRYGSVAGLLSAIETGEVRRHLGVRPINLEMDITNQCNLRCVMCPFSRPEFYKRKTKHMPIEVFQKLAGDLFFSVHYLSLAYGTEALLHPEFTRIIEIASQYGIEKLYTNTNGTLLTEKLAESMVENGFHGLSISIDAATSETYDRIRKGGDFNRVIENIRGVNRIRDRAGAKYPEVTLLFVLMRQNLHELPAFVDLARDLGAVGINATHMIPFEMLGNEGRTAAMDKRLCNEMLREAREKARKAGMFFSGPREFDPDKGSSDSGMIEESAAQENASHHQTGTPGNDRSFELRQRFGLNMSPDWEARSPCPFPWHFMAIDAQGNVIPCGWWYGQRVLGNIYDQNVLEIWLNDEYNALREELSTRLPRNCCRNCPAAGIGDPNQASSFSSR